MNRVPSRSPHPYHRKSLSSPTAPSISSSTSDIQPLDPEFTKHVVQERLFSPADSVAASTASHSSSEESGTEADDEREPEWLQKGPYLSRRRTLPAPPRSKGRWEVDDDERPGGSDPVLGSGTTTPTGTKEIDSEEKAKHIVKSSTLGGRKKIVFFRRSLEVALMAVLSGIVCYQPAVRVEVIRSKNEIGAFLLSLAIVTALQPSRSFIRNPQSVSLPPALDPSSLLYPILFPPLISLSLQPYTQLYLMPALICSLASIPPGLYFGTIFADGNLRYLITVAPLLCSGVITQDVAERLTYMPLIHANLVSLGMDLVIPSLSTTETRLLATSLVSLLYNSMTSQMVILTVILWWTGGALLVLGKRFMESEVELERSLVIARGRMRARIRRERLIVSNATDDESLSPPPLSKRSPTRSPPRLSGPPQPRSLLDVLPSKIPDNISFWRYAYAIPVYLILAVTILFYERPYIARHALAGIDPFFWAIGYLLSDLPFYQDLVKSLRLDSFQGIEVHGRELRWGPNFRLALAGYWATAVLVGVWFVITLGKGVRVPIEKLGLEIHGPGWLGLAEVARGRAVEVDTRRKVFHGLVVAMFLPTVFLDPPFVAISFVVALALFLILDILRASLLPPLSRPLSVFLAPYVDGRDLRGPIVVSHVFLLIGCAIPLWLSLSGATFNVSDRDAERAFNAPFGSYWIAPVRELAMISGIVCVGMGDAAASLIGRRFGKHKWGWSGGKSLEGSLAFTLAVCLGLMVAKLLLVAGSFVPGQGGIGRGGLRALQEITLAGSTDFILKATVVGAIGSLLEAVITGGNDNVMIPVVLWLAIRGLKI